jgi:hypothetical protein
MATMMPVIREEKGKKMERKGGAARRVMEFTVENSPALSSPDKTKPQPPAPSPAKPAGPGKGKPKA